MNSHNGCGHPAVTLQENAKNWGLSIDDLQFAVRMDENDPLRSFRSEFCYPLKKTLPGVDLQLLSDEHEECVYMCGNSLGLQPKGLRDIMERQLVKWAQMGAHGHEEGELPWAHCDICVEEDMAKLVGAKQEEVALMNGLTVNLHLLMISFYRPTPSRHKILLEKHAFPSDHYAVESQIRLHGYDPDTSMIFVQPRQGEDLIQPEDIIQVIEEHGDSISVVLLPGVQYYTGQVFDMSAITKAAHDKDCYVGFDLAHAVGNIELHLHDWNVDFAAWCSYKYVNTGAGGIAGAFLHEKFMQNDFPKLLGWWGVKYDTRFKMTNESDPIEGIKAYKISNPPIFLCASLRASLNIFNKTSMSELRAKSLLLTGYLELLLQQNLGKTDSAAPYVTIITPRDPEQRGSQLSIMVSVPVNQAFDELVKRGVVLDMRKPNVLRVAPTPLYNSFKDVYLFVQLLQKALASLLE